MKNTTSNNASKKNLALITGIGIHSCIATNIEDYAAALREGRCGLHHDAARLAAGFQSDLCGNVPQVEDEQLGDLSRTQRQCLSLPARYALNAVRQALEYAAVSEEYLHTKNVSLIVSNDSSAEAFTQTLRTMRENNDTRTLGSGAAFRSIASTVSMSLASILGIHGLSLTMSAACAGGGHALGLAKSLLESGQSDMVIVVGAQETAIPALCAFDALGVFSPDCVRPFGKGRNGLAPSGGAACVVLERALTRFNRNKRVKPLGVLSGYGFSTNGSEISTPSAEMEAQAMSNAIVSAGGEMPDVVLAHATGTPLGDAAEANAICQVVQSAPRVVATKGMTGHECWMSGVSQVVQAVLFLRDGFLPAAVGTDECEDERLNLVMKAEEYAPERILCNAFGFGGTNASFVISKY